MPTPNQYDAIYLWHKQSGSFPYYWQLMQQRASKEGAPLDAIYYDDLTGWVTIGDLAPEHHFRTDYRDYLASKGDAP